MARYIDAEKAMTRIQKRQGMCYRDEEYWGLEVARAFISGLPTEDVTPVVHARWIVNRDYGDCTCSACGTVYEDNGETISDYWNYCPHCGARTDKVGYI